MGHLGSAAVRRKRIRIQEAIKAQQKIPIIFDAASNFSLFLMEVCGIVLAVFKYRNFCIQYIFL